MCCAGDRYEACDDPLFFGWQVDSLSSLVPWGNHHLSSALAEWSTFRRCAGSDQTPFCVSAALLGQCLRFFQKSFHHRLCAPRRSSRSLSAYSEIEHSEYSCTSHAFVAA